MTCLKPSWQSVLAIVFCLVAFALGTMSKPDLPGDSHFRLEVWAETLDDSETAN